MKMIANDIVEALLDQPEFPLHDRRDLTTSLANHPDPEAPGPWGRIIKRMKEREAAKAERNAAEREAAHYRASMKPV